MAIDLSVKAWGQTFKNPIVVASATPSKDAEYMRRCCEAGAGGIIAKTVGYESALQHYPRPRFTVLHKKGWPDIFSNYSCEFIAEYTPEEWMPQLKQAKKYCDDYGVVLVGSIAGSTLDDWAKLARMVEDQGIEVLELNFGCPHPRDLDYKTGAELGGDPDAAAEVTAAVANAVKIPVIVKVTAEGVNPVVTATKVTAAGAAGVTAVNRFPALEIDLPSGRPLLHGTYAGVNGPWMRPITLKWIARIAKEGIKVSATNGIWTWEDVVKVTMVGAYTVQTCNAILYGTKGYGAIKDFNDGVARFLEENGYKSLDEIRGKTLNQISRWTDAPRESNVWSVIDPEKCTGCRMCLNWCFTDALEVYELNGKTKVRINRDKCDACGLCVSLCPKNAGHMEGDEPIYQGNFR